MHISESPVDDSIKNIQHKTVLKEIMRAKLLLSSWISNNCNVFRYNGKSLCLLLQAKTNTFGKKKEKVNFCCKKMLQKRDVKYGPITENSQVCCHPNCEIQRGACYFHGFVEWADCTPVSNSFKDSFIKLVRVITFPTSICC